MCVNFEEFIVHLEHEKRYSGNTVVAYKKDLEDFTSFLWLTYQINSEKDVTHTFIRDWILTLLEQGNTVGSVKRKISTLRSYFKFLIRREVVLENPMTKIVAPKSPKTIPSYVKESDMKELLFEMKFSDDFYGRRDRLILEMFYQTGMRVSELIGLTLEDVDLSRNQIKVLGKRNKERFIPVSVKLTELLNVYIKDREVVFSSSLSSDLIVTDNGQKAYRKFVYNKVNYYLSQVSSLKKRSPHVLRHTFATHMLKNGADLNAIKEILGHASLAATQVYAHNSLEQLKQAHKRAHPRS